MEFVHQNLVLYFLSGFDYLAKNGNSNVEEKEAVKNGNLSEEDIKALLSSTESKMKILETSLKQKEDEISGLSRKVSEKDLMIESLKQQILEYREEKKSFFNQIQQFEK